MGPLQNALPVCGELIWIDIFTLVNTFFCCFSLFQSALNIMLENYDADALLRHRQNPVQLQDGRLQAAR